MTCSELQSELQSYLREHIPLADAMDVRVEAIERHSITLAAPLEPNINLHGTAFGGSMSTLATLSAWAVLHMRLEAAGVDNRLVIQRHTMSYDVPVSDEMIAKATLADDDVWRQFIERLAKRGRARLPVEAVLLSNGVTSGQFVGDFVALDAVFRKE